MIKANVILDYPKWKTKIKNPSQYIKKRLQILSKIYSFKYKNQEFTIFLTNNKKMKNLNNKFRKKNKTTDVLSFPFYNSKEIKYKKKLYLGDVILNFYKIKKNNFEEEFNKLWIHGFLHLIGHKHYTDNDFYKMNKLENKIFKKIIC